MNSSGKPRLIGRNKLIGQTKFQSDKFQRQIAANWKKQINWTSRDEMNHMDYNGQQKCMEKNTAQTTTAQKLDKTYSLLF